MVTWMVTKGHSTSVILPVMFHPATNGVSYNADLGNGAEGKAGDCVPQPHFLLAIAAKYLIARFQPSRRSAHRNNQAARGCNVKNLAE
jgi:hypothetical protein